MRVVHGAKIVSVSIEDYDTATISSNGAASYEVAYIFIKPYLHMMNNLLTLPYADIGTNGSI